MKDSLKKIYRDGGLFYASGKKSKYETWSMMVTKQKNMGPDLEKGEEDEDSTQSSEAGEGEKDGDEGGTEDSQGEEEAAKDDSQNEVPDTTNHSRPTASGSRPRRILHGYWPRYPTWKSSGHQRQPIVGGRVGALSAPRKRLPSMEEVRAAKRTKHS